MKRYQCMLLALVCLLAVWASLMFGWVDAGLDSRSMAVLRLVRTRRPRRVPHRRYRGSPRLLPMPLCLGATSYRPCRACPQLPMYLLVSFGCYSLGVIGFNLFRFNDCREASDELVQASARRCGWTASPRTR